MERQHFVHVVAYGVAWGGFPDLSRDRESTQGGIVEAIRETLGEDSPLLASIHARHKSASCAPPATVRLDGRNGFWPSRDRNAAGYVEPSRFAEAQTAAKERMAALESFGATLAAGAVRRL